MNIVVTAPEVAVRDALRARLAAAGIERTPDGAHPVVLTGIHWPAIRPLIAEAVGRGQSVVALLDDAGVGAAHPAFQSGASAVLRSDVSPPGLGAALVAVAHGLAVLPGRSPAPLRDVRPAPLSERERDVLELVAIGLPTKSIARRLGLSPNTVKHHIAAIFRKLGARTRAEALHAAVRCGEFTV